MADSSETTSVVIVWSTLIVKAAVACSCQEDLEQEVWWKRTTHVPGESDVFDPGGVEVLDYNPSFSSEGVLRTERTMSEVAARCPEVSTDHSGAKRNALV